MIGAARLGALYLAMLAPAGASIAARFETAAWRVELKPVGRAVVGQPAVLEVIVEARGGYHLNDDYPLNFRASPDAAIVFDKLRIDRKDGITTVPCAGEPHACSARIPARYTAKTAGKAQLGGVVAFSACDAEHCLIEKIDLAAAVDVAAR